MNEEKYTVIVDDQEIAGKHMKLKFALALADKLFEKYYNEPNLKISIQREDTTDLHAIEIEDPHAICDEVF